MPSTKGKCVSTMNLLTTYAGSMMEGFLPRGWDLARIDRCCSLTPESIGDRQPWWHPAFQPVACESVADFDVMMGHEIALAIKQSREADQKAAMILPVGPMGMYRWAVYFLKEWKVPCDHVFGFNMDEWSDSSGNTLAPDHPGSFQNAMEAAFYGPLGELTVPPEHRWFATPDRLPLYAGRIAELKAEGARLHVIFGIGRVCHIAFWEPHFADEFAGVQEWKAQTHRLGRAPAPAHDRAERAHQLQEPHHARPRLRQHHRPGPVSPGRPDHRRRGRSVRSRHAVARRQPLDDLALWPGPLGAELVHAHAPRPALLPPRAGGTAGAGHELACRQLSRKAWMSAIARSTLSRCAVSASISFSWARRWTRSSFLSCGVSPCPHR